MKREVMIINCSLVRPYFHRIEKQRQKHGENWFIFRFSNRSHFTAAPWPFSNSFFFSFRVKCCRLKREVHIHDSSSSFYYLRLIRILICLFSALLIISMHAWGRGKKSLSIRATNPLPTTTKILFSIRRLKKGSQSELLHSHSRTAPAESQWDVYNRKVERKRENKYEH